MPHSPCLILKAWRIPEESQVLGPSPQKLGSTVLWSANDDSSSSRSSDKVDALTSKKSKQAGEGDSFSHGPLISDCHREVPSTLQEDFPAQLILPRNTLTDLR